jgi:hypothetical protein
MLYSAKKYAAVCEDRFTGNDVAMFLEMEACELSDEDIKQHFGVEVTELDEPETPFWRPVMTNTVADLRSVVNNAMNRGEHNIAIALIELIKKNS